MELDRLAGRRRERECRGPLSQRTLCFSYFSVLPEKPIWVKEQFLTRLSLQLCGTDRAALQATGFSRCDQSARRTHPLCSKPAGLGVQLKPPAEEQDGEEHDQHTEGNTGCVHRMTLPGEFFIDPSISSQPVAHVTCRHSGAVRLRARSVQTARLTAHSLKSLRWENFRWTGLGQKT